MNPIDREGLLPGEVWDYRQFSQFIRESHPHGPRRRSLEFPRQIDTGTIGEVTDRLVTATNNYGALPQRKERARYMRIEREPTEAFVYSQEWIGSLESLRETKLPALTTVEEPGLKEGFAFFMHSHAFPSVFSPLETLWLRLPSPAAPVGMTVGGEDIKCMVLRSAETQALISLRALLDKMQGVDDREGGKVVAEIFKNNLLNSSVASNFRRVNELSADPLVLFDEAKRKELVSLYDLILRERARDAGLVVYRGKVGNKLMEKCNLDFPIFPFK